jgi:chromate transporter
LSARGPAGQEGNVGEVLGASLALGLTSFGGPIAHIGYFRREYVERRRWLDDAAFADLVALCQFLPGPASSQLGIAIGTRRSGLAGGLAAWLGFTLPSAIAMLAFAYLLSALDFSASGWVHGLKLAAVAVVAQALWAMARALTPDAARQSIAFAAAAVVIIWASAAAQIVVIAAGALLGRLVLRPPAAVMAGPGWRVVPRSVGVAALALFAVLLVGLPLAAGVGGPAALFESFYRSGSLVFGGGHVVLPLLHASVVEPGWVSQDAFLAGYGAAQALPGPLFTIAAFLGALAVVPASNAPAGVPGALLALAAIFLPSFLLVFGTLPFWDALRRSTGFRRALAGSNAAVVGLLAAAFWNPIWTSSIRVPADAAIAGAGLALLASRRVPPIAVVILAALTSQLLPAA